MNKVMQGKPVPVREAVDHADSLMFGMNPAGERKSLEAHQSHLWRAYFALNQSDEPEVHEFGHMLAMEALLSVPADVIGEVVHAAARRIHAVLQADLTGQLLPPNPLDEVAEPEEAMLTAA